MVNEDFAASLRDSARTEDEYKNHIEEQKRMEEEARRKAVEARIKEEEIRLYDSFVESFKSIIQKGLSEGKFNIETVNGKKKVSGEICFFKSISYNWDEEDMGRAVTIHSESGCIKSNTGVDFGRFAVPEFYSFKCTNSSAGSRFFSKISSPEVVCIEKKDAINAFVFNVNKRLDGVAKITNVGNTSIKYIEKKETRGKLLNAGDLTAHHAYNRKYYYRFSHTFSFIVEF